MLFHWICFIVPSHLEICSFIVILVCFSLFYSVYAKKRKKKGKKKKRKEKNINKCTRVYIRYQYQYSWSMYMDL